MGLATQLLKIRIEDVALTLKLRFFDLKEVFPRFIIQEDCFQRFFYFPHETMGNGRFFGLLTWYGQKVQYPVGRGVLVFFHGMAGSDKDLPTQYTIWRLLNDLTEGGEGEKSQLTLWLVKFQVVSHAHSPVNLDS